MRGILRGRINGSPVLLCPDDVVVGRGIVCTGIKIVDDESTIEFGCEESNGTGNFLQVVVAIRRSDGMGVEGGLKVVVVLVRGEIRPT